MIEREFTINNRLGMHARPAGMFVKEATRFKADILINKDGLEINGKSIMGLMLLAAECGAKIKVRATGPDEKEAIEALGKLIDRKFDED